MEQQLKSGPSSRALWGNLATSEEGGGGTITLLTYTPPGEKKKKNTRGRFSFSYNDFLYGVWLHTKSPGPF